MILLWQTAFWFSMTTDARITAIIVDDCSSASLTTMSFLKQLKKVNGKPTCKMIGLYYFHRYWRYVIHSLSLSLLSPYSLSLLSLSLLSLSLLSLSLPTLSLLSPYSLSLLSLSLLYISLLVYVPHILCQPHVYLISVSERLCGIVLSVRPVECPGYFSLTQLQHVHTCMHM